MFDIPCIIFAGGKSSRMGEDKALLPFGDSLTLTEYQLNKLQKIFKDVYISCKDSSKFSFEANFIEDVITNNIFAPTIGFISIFKSLKHAQKVFVISVDTPFISETEIKTIIEKDTNNSDATIAKTDEGIQPLCGMYHKSLEIKFLEMLESDTHKLGLVLQNSNTTYVSFTDSQPFLNLNNPQDYQKALTLI